eukprot:scaffold7838_cov140-Skeletonema_marinoi.AAC.13
MARGDQRERDRAKKLARLQKEQKGGPKVQLRPHFSNSVGGPDSLEHRGYHYIIIVPQKCGPIEGNPESRNLNDSAALAAKVAKKAEMKKKQEEEEQRNAANKPVVVKSKAKKKKEPAGLDDLLSAGLAKGKKK